MPEQEETEYVSHPLVSVQEFMDRYGFNAQSTMFTSEDQAKAMMGKLLERAKSWFKTWTGWTFSEGENIPEDKQSLMADCIYARAAYFMYLRMSNLRWDVADHFRVLARMQKEDFSKMVVTLKKTKINSRYVVFEDSYIAEKVEDV